MTFASADEKIATVDKNGNVKAVSKGKTVITIQSVQNSEVKATVNIEVKRAVKEISLNIKERTLYSGDSLELVATITPADASNLSVTWSSSDETVARVNNKGVVTALKGGEAVITVTSADSGKTAQCKCQKNFGPASIYGAKRLGCQQTAHILSVRNGNTAA